MSMKCHIAKNKSKIDGLGPVGEFLPSNMNKS